MKLVEIAQSWLQLAEGDPELVAMAQRRLEICDTCEFKKQLSTAGAALVQLVNSRSSIYYCGDCGCPLASKTIGPGNECTQGKWKAEVVSYY